MSSRSDQKCIFWIRGLILLLYIITYVRKKGWGNPGLDIFFLTLFIIAKKSAQFK